MKRYFDSYKAVAQMLIAEAKNYNEELFETQPAPGQWSLGQMYWHIASVTDVCLANIEVCKAGKGETKLLAVGPAIFSLMGSFPPIKLHIKNVPDVVAHLYNPKKTTISDAIIALQKSIEKMEQYLPIVLSTDKKQRVKHWAGGWFTAAQWYQSAEMHIRHHLRQKKRIDLFLAGKQ